MRIRTFSTLLLVAALLPAQDAPKNAAPADAAATAKIGKALQATAAMQNTAFGANWGPQVPKDGNAAMSAVLVDRLSGKVSGAFFDDRLAVAFDNQERDEFVQVGRHTLARSRDGEWRLRKASYADGNAAEFVPDPPLLLRMLAGLELAPTQRAVGSLDDRPVEIVSATLTREQVAELLFAGALPKPFAATRSVAVGAAGRAPAATPEATVDLAITLDPATGIVHKVHLRTYAKKSGGAIAMVGAGGRVQVANAEPEKKEEAAEPAPGTPLEYVDGLPVRADTGKMVANYEVRLREHGQVQVPVLDDKQRRLLGH